MPEVRPQPDVSVVIPARNEWTHLPSTVHSIIEGRRTESFHEIVIVDDCSTTGAGELIECLASEVRQQGVDLRIYRSSMRLGVGGARNRGAQMARGKVLFFTDAHVRIGAGWDSHISRYATSNRILAATIRDPESSFAGFGCELVVPFMGTRWAREPRDEVQIPSAAGTVIYRDLFFEIGGYDRGMLHYGAIEPEFGVRSWLSGAVTTSATELEVHHRFKDGTDLNDFIAAHRESMVHNALRFGLLYLPRATALQMIRYYAAQFPEEAKTAFRHIESSDVWRRRERLRRSLTHDFIWYVKHFNLHDQIGRSLQCES